MKLYRTSDHDNYEESVLTLSDIFVEEDDLLREECTNDKVQEDKCLVVKGKCEGFEVDLLIDTGCCASIIAEDLYNQIQKVS